MKILLASAVLLMVCGATRHARADACHGSPGGGDGGGGGPGGESSTDSGCSEVSDVVGRQRCGHFGSTWAGRAGLPAVTTEVGFFTRRLRTGFGARGVMDHDTASFAYRVAAEDELATAAGGALRIAMALPAHLYIGADLEVGSLVSGTGADVEMSGSVVPMPVMEARRKIYVGAGAVAGVRAHLGPAALSAELVAGARDVSLSVESRHGACILHDTHHRTSVFAEPRVRVDVWLSPWLTIAGFAGSELDGASRMIGASLAFHLRAYDRTR
jgi:hypothetical protein